MQSRNTFCLRGRDIPIESVNVLVTTPVGDESRRKIMAISPRIKLTDAYELLREDLKGNTAAQQEFSSLLADTEVIYGRIPINFVTRAPMLKWIQLMSAGVNMFTDTGVTETTVKITTIRGVQSTPIAEFVLAFMLMFIKQAPACFQMKQENAWKSLSPGELRGKTVGIIGLGSVGREVARLSKAFGMTVIATRRSAGPDDRAKYVDTLLPSAQMKQLMTESDFVVIAIPLTRETTKLIGEAELSVMKPSSYLINIARGNVVDEKALVRTLEDKRIAGAGLDVFSAEPLPPTSRLWELPNVIISPHIAGVFEDRAEQAIGMFLDNLKRYLDGKRLLNVVDKNKGY